MSALHVPQLYNVVDTESHALYVHSNFDQVKTIKPSARLPLQCTVEIYKQLQHVNFDLGYYWALGNNSTVGNFLA